MAAIQKKQTNRFELKEEKSIIDRFQIALGVSYR